MKKQPSPTIEDVARRAGVSRSTASLVINKSPLVREKTRLLVEKVIEEIHYVPNSNARALSARTTGNLGVIFMQDYLPDSTQISYNNDQHVGLASFNFSNGIMAGLAGTDYGIIMERFCSVNAPDALPRIVNEKRVDGVFIVGLPYSAHFIANLQKTGLPFVLVGIGNQLEGVDSIYAEPGEGTEMAVRELLETGHRRICLLNCPASLPSHHGRLEGCLRAMEAYGIPFDPAWNICSGSNNGQSACEAFRAFWEAGNRPDGIVAANGQSAAGVMAYLYQAGIRVPDAVSIITYEDSSLCGYAAPALTAVNVRKEEIGAQAARCLMERIKHPDKPIEQLPLPPYLVRRDSVQDRPIRRNDL